MAALAVRDLCQNRTGTRHGRRLLARDGGGLSLAIFRQASRDMRNPISGQHLGFIGLVRAFALPDLLGATFFRGFAIFGSDCIRVDQLLSKGRFTKCDRSNKTEVPKWFQGISPWLAVRKIQRSSPGRSMLRAETRLVRCRRIWRRFARFRRHPELRERGKELLRQQSFCGLQSRPQYGGRFCSCSSACLWCL
jgi:hypothetical protein